MAAASDRSLCRVHYHRCCSDLTSGRPLPAARCTGCEAAKHELGPRTSDANVQDAQEHRQPQRAQVQTLSAAQSYEARRAQLGRHICHQSPGAHRHRCLQRRDAACEHAGRRKLNPSRNRNHVTLAAVHVLASGLPSQPRKLDEDSRHSARPSRVSVQRPRAAPARKEDDTGALCAVERASACCAALMDRACVAGHTARTPRRSEPRSD